YWLVYKCALEKGVIPSSINELYRARGNKETGGFTVPAMNIRTLTFDLARAVFKVAKNMNAGTFIFEIAKSEIGYTGQRPLEYATLVMLAALKEGYQGPIFLQGDHFQVNADRYLKNPQGETAKLKTLIKEAVAAHFYNIDIDSSTLVDLSESELDAQQKLNYELCAFFTDYIRKLQPKGIDISIGGEIGEVGGKNSTPEELHAFMQGYRRISGSEGGISKISIQTGTSHGGVILPDGSIAKANIDFDTLSNLSRISIEDYTLAGAVQHGASTLPNEAFHHFPEANCAEIHLATQFQNMVYDYLPLPLKEKIYNWLYENLSQERKPDWTNDQFIYKTRKKALGPFKREIHSLSRDIKNKISEVLEEEFAFLFDKLKISNTAGLIKKYVPAVSIEKNKEHFLEKEENLGELQGAD
ncbi:MAG: aldolase, partial [Candidatus Omnitrophica bacterium]|nr:aldolase [Candidatus Omnitrophota bacterium]MBD3269793.1 aldolase [Candidatus Omnitrophota bacterium]